MLESSLLSPEYVLKGKQHTSDTGRSCNCESTCKKFLQYLFHTYGKLGDCLLDRASQGVQIYKSLQKSRMYSHLLLLCDFLTLRGQILNASFPCQIIVTCTPTFLTFA